MPIHQTVGCRDGIGVFSMAIFTARVYPVMRLDPFWLGASTQTLKVPIEMGERTKKTKNIWGKPIFMDQWSCLGTVVSEFGNRKANLPSGDNRKFTM